MRRVAVAKEYGMNAVAIARGVACNSARREAMERALTQNGLKLV